MKICLSNQGWTSPDIGINANEPSYHWKAYIGCRYGGAGRCAHGDTHEDEDKEVIETGSVDFKELRKIVWNVKFLRKTSYFLNFG